MESEDVPHTTQATAGDGNIRITGWQPACEQTVTIGLRRVPCGTES